jgi:proteasome lid subunit RPN8/RPN11
MERVEGEAVGVAPGLLDRILEHARAEAPNECCGLVIGTSRRLDVAWPARNLLASPTRFEVDPVDHFAAVRVARERGLEVVGAYHSHPATPPVPSPRDLLEARDADLLYLVAGLAEREVRAYRLSGGNFRQVALVPSS